MILETVEAVVKNLGARMRSGVLAWAEREQLKLEERRQRERVARREAERWLVQRVTEGQCVHTRPEDMNPERGKWVYCDDCPLGRLHPEPALGDWALSYEAQRVLCTRRRQYSK